MRNIDVETWPRREHFRFFNAWEYPHFSICANVDLTSFYPAATILVSEDLFSFCFFEYFEDFSLFAEKAAE